MLTSALQGCFQACRGPRHPWNEVGIPGRESCPRALDKHILEPMSRA